ncbi:MAG TPA: exosortase/archaeosortase family protein [Syntrophales bacterium]|nr:exosortase/archaeosortase family protein [Syntrophales bacterium]HOL59794.1 exosortase/archaeosortase family protein [Syntrophales bacterium]HPO35988.1 exosortase/archaeosortase family protein [Syntrophales bacterium]
MTRIKIYLLALAFFFAYHPVIYDLRDAVFTNELAHHTPLVLLLTGYLIYAKREEIRKILSSPLKPDQGAWMFAGLGVNLLGLGAGVYYLAQLSIPLTIFGALRYVVGQELARFLAPSLLFLILAFPLPGKVYVSLVFPLKLFVTHISGVMLSLLGFPVRVHGNIIELPSMTVGVEDACSGLSSLMAMTTLAVFCGLSFLKTWKSRAIVMVVVLPAIMLANVFRVTLSTMMAWKWGVWMLEGTFHLLWGLLVFVVAVILLILAVMILKRRERRGFFGER